MNWMETPLLSPIEVIGLAFLTSFLYALVRTWKMRQFARTIGTLEEKGRAIVPTRYGDTVVQTDLTQDDEPALTLGNIEFLVRRYL